MIRELDQEWPELTDQRIAGKADRAGRPARRRGTLPSEDVTSARRSGRPSWAIGAADRLSWAIGQKELQFLPK